MNLAPSLAGLTEFPNFAIPRHIDPRLPRIRRTRSYDVTFERQKLQHGFMWPLEPLYVAFDSWHSTASFSIDYFLHSGNMLEDEEGQLHVVVNLK
jgi:hypothetical protein